MGPPQCSWQSLHREMGHDDLNAGCGPTSGQSKQAVDPATSPARRHRPGIKRRCCIATRWLEPTTSASRSTWGWPTLGQSCDKNPCDTPVLRAALLPRLLPPPGALGKLSSSNLHCPSGLLITEPSGPTDLYSHHLPRAPQPPGVATPPVTILQMKTRGTWTVGQGMAWEPKLVRTVLLLPPSSSRCHPRPPGL